MTLAVDEAAFDADATPVDDDEKDAEEAALEALETTEEVEDDEAVAADDKLDDADGLMIGRKV